MKLRMSAWRSAEFAAMFVLTLFVTRPTFGTGVTLITHGFESGVINHERGWMEAMGDHIAERVGGTKYIYRLEIIEGYTKTSLNPHGLGLGSFTCQNAGLPDIEQSSDAEIVIKLYWDSIANSLLGDVTTTEIAVAALPAFTDPPFAPFLNKRLIETPIHLIGHSRGGSVVSELARLLGEKGIWASQITTLDPHPTITVGLSSDAPVNVYETVLFADNYWESDSFPDTDLDFTVSGQSVSGAYNRFLSEDVISNGGYTDPFAEHENVHLWYHGTIDVSSSASDGTQAITDAMRSNWYMSNENLGQKAGFYYSRLGGGAGVLDGFLFGYNDGNHNILPDQRVNIVRNPNEWPSLVTFIITGNASVHAGAVLPAHCILQSYDSSCSITTFLDRDQNPYNGNEIAMVNTPSAFNATDRLTKAVDLSATVPSGTPSGLYYVYAKISNSNGSRYLYAGTQVFVQAPASISPKIDAVLPTTLTVSAQAQRLTITGTGFTSASTLLFSDQTVSVPAQLHYVSATEIQYDKIFSTSGQWSVQVVNAGLKSLPASFYVVSGSGPKQLIGLSITGPATVNENSPAASPFTATAQYSDGSSPSVIPMWGVSGGSANITVAGQLSAGSVSANTDVTVSASFTDGGVTKSASKTVTITKAINGVIQTQNLIVNGDFLNGGSGWGLTGAFQAGSTFTRCHSCPGYAYLANSDGTPGNNLVGTLSQTFTIPANAVEAALIYWHLTTTQETGGNADQLNVSLHFSSGSFLTLENIWNSNDSAYIQSSFDLTAYKGQTVTLMFTGTTSPSLPTTFRIDDVSLTVTLQPPPTPVFLGIRGPTSLLENSSAPYDVVVGFTDGTVKPASSASWSVSPTGTISSSGASATLIAGSVTSDAMTTITVNDTEGSTPLHLEYAVTILHLTRPAFGFLSIDGPSSIIEKGSVQFTASAIFDNGDRKPISLNNWAVTAPGTINAGLLTAGEVTSDTVITISGSATIDGVTQTGSKSVLITHVPVPPALVLLNIIGPSVLSGNTTTQYTAIATFSDGSSGPVAAVWGKDSSSVDISNSGILSVGAISTNISVTISASYSAGGLTQTASESVTVLASSATQGYTLTVSANNGSVTKNPDQANYASGTQVILTARPALGYQFINWSGDTNGSVNPLPLIMDANKSVTANFVAVSLPNFGELSNSNGTFRFSLRGLVGSNYVVQASSNLVDWAPLGTYTIPSTGLLPISDLGVATLQRRFYRAVSTNPMPTITLIASGLDYANLLVLDDANIYFPGNGLHDSVQTIKSVKKLGGSATTLFTGATLFDSGGWRGVARMQLDSSYLYGDYGGYVSLNVFKGSTSGGVLTTLASPTGGQFICVVGNDLYFASNYGTLNRMPKSGGTATALLNGYWMRSTAFDNGAIYFVHYDTKDVKKYSFAAVAVTTLITGNSSEGTIFSDSQSVYLTVDGNIKAVSKSGGSVTTLVSTGTAGGILSDDVHVYFYDGSVIKTVPVGGGTASLLITPAKGSVASLAIDSSYVYWAEITGVAGEGKIWRMTKP